MSALRSGRWVAGDDEVAVLHRAALRTGGVPVGRHETRPVVGVANSASELNPCNLPLVELAGAVKEGIAAAGGLPVEFPTMSLGEDLMKPSAMLYRNLLAMEVEESLRAHPLDAVVLLANCDKTVPAMLMGAASADLPAVVVTGGARRPATYRGRRIGTGTDLWRLWEQRRKGDLGDAAWDELEDCLSCERGACNTMGTASTMAILAETLGMAMPGSSSIPTGSPEALVAAREAGRRAVAMVSEGLRPSGLLTPAAFANAVVVLYAIGGSTNAVIHLAALAGRVGQRLRPGDLAQMGKGVPVLADVEPTGSGLMPDFHAAGGVPALLRVIAELLDLGARSVAGCDLAEVVSRAPVAGGAIRSLDEPAHPGPAFAALQGNLVPDGAVLRVCTASPGLLRHEGPAVVFDGYDDLVGRIDDPDLAVNADSVLVLRGCGPVGAPGMPEWMPPIPSRLAAAGVEDMVRITDARMSGTSYGTVVLHAAPEAAVGGPLALLRDGDRVRLDAHQGRLDVLLTTEELGQRAADWRPPVSPHRRGWPALYQAHVTQAPEGCDFDFLMPTDDADRTFVEPTVGRS